MANETWTKTTLGSVFDTLGNNVGSGDGAGTITLTSATVQVTNGNTLRIEDGVTVKMFTSGTRRFLVTRNATGSGTLRIVGTAISPVRITSGEVSPAPGDYTQAIEMANGTAASNAVLEADWCIIEYAATGIFGSGSQPNTVTLRHCTFRRIQASHVQTSAGQIIGAAGLWRIESCVFDRCANDDVASVNANNVIVCSGTSPSGSGVALRMEVDHCSISCIDDNATTDKEVFQAGPRGTLDVRNSLFVGTNAEPTRTVDNSVIVAPNGVMTNDWNWYFTEGLGQWIDGANDQSKNPLFFDTGCVANQDLRPHFDTGVTTADEFGGLLGALEAYGEPPDPEPPAPEPECVDTYAGFVDPACVPFVCDYDFFTGDYPEDWRQMLYDRKECQPHRLTVCMQIPTRGIPLDFEFAPGVPIPVVGTSDSATTIDIGCWVNSMRPIRAERDVTFREYQGSDVDLVMVDWFGRLDPKINPSLFANIRWRGLRVDLGSWIFGTEQVLRHGRYFLWDIKRRGEFTVLTLRDWFLETLDVGLRANAAGFNLTFKSKNPIVSFDVDFLEVDPDIATIETVRLIAQDDGAESSQSFQYVGSVTGEQGIGTFDADFTTADGAVTIRRSAWGAAGYNVPVFAPKDEVSFTVSSLVTGNPVSVVYQYLVDFGPLFEGTDIDQAEFFAAEALLPSLTEIQLRHDRPVTLLEACRLAAAHGFLTLSTNALGHVVLGGFKPTLSLDLSEIQDFAICGSNDLKELETQNLPIYNLIRSGYNPVEADEISHSGLVGGTPSRWLEYPPPDLGPTFNRSAIFYGTPGAPRYFPLPVELPGFRKGHEAAVFAVLQMYWIFFEGTPTAREVLTLDTKLHNLNRDLEQIVRIESSRPARQVWGQLVGYGKDPLKQNIELTAVDVSDIVQPDFACGYAFCDSGHYCDDCWVCW